MTQDERRKFLEETLVRHVNEYGDQNMLAKMRLDAARHECGEDCDGTCDSDPEADRAEAAVHARLAQAAATMATVATAALQRI